MLPGIGHGPLDHDSFDGRGKEQAQPAGIIVRAGAMLNPRLGG
jgi:hypothetical protein